NVFATITRKICPDCHRKEEIAFKKVYHFLRQRKNREATVAEIVEATDVEEALVLKFLKENRLRASQFPNLKYPCGRCQTLILEGNYCQKCINEIKQAWTKSKDDDEKEYKGSVYHTWNAQK